MADTKFRASTENPRWSHSTGYDAVHKRLSRYRGRASDHDCDCGRPAAQWAYDHADPSEHTQTLTIRGKDVVLAYSTDLARYLPMCHPCHRRFDRG